MKNIKLLAGIFLILTAFTFTSCDNEPIDPNIDLDDFENPVNGPAVFKADFSGETWTASATQAIKSNNLISIGGAKADGSAFSILISGSTPGTYPANTNIVAYTPAGSEFGYWSVNSLNPTDDTGSVVITSINTTNHTISGTFSFKGYWSDASTTSILPVEFTNGVFTNIPYQDNNTPPPTGNYFIKALKDGSAKEWNTIQAQYVLLGSERSLLIIGSDGATSMNLHISSDTADIPVGTYPLEWVSVGCGYTEGMSIFSSDYSDFTTSPGSITITEFNATNQTIKGTFNFTGKNDAMTVSKVFSNGEFFVHYTQ